MAHHQVGLPYIATVHSRRKQLRGDGSAGPKVHSNKPVNAEMR